MTNTDITKIVKNLPIPSIIKLRTIFKNASDATYDKTIAKISEDEAWTQIDVLVKEFDFVQNNNSIDIEYILDFFKNFMTILSKTNSCNFQMGFHVDGNKDLKEKYIVFYLLLAKIVSFNLHATGQWNTGMGDPPVETTFQTYMWRFIISYKLQNIFDPNYITGKFNAFNESYAVYNQVMAFMRTLMRDVYESEMQEQMDTINMDLACINAQLTVTNLSETKRTQLISQKDSLSAKLEKITNSISFFRS